MNLKEYLAKDQVDYYPLMSKERFLDWLLKTEQYWIKSYLKALRKEEFYTFVQPNKLFMLYYRRMKNNHGSRLGFFISAGNFGSGLKMYHYGSVIVHPKAKIGLNCTLHGNCCIGSKGTFPDIPPTIGDNVDIGQGAQILGDITIADGVKIGAGAVVTKSILTPNVVVVGVPARVL